MPPRIEKVGTKPLPKQGTTSTSTSTSTTVQSAHNQQSSVSSEVGTTRRVDNPNVSLLQRLRGVSGVKKGLSFAVYGEPKTGKTFFSLTFPKPILLLGTEDGSDTGQGLSEDQLQFGRIYNSTDIDEAVEILKGGKFKTVVLDTVGGLQDLVMREFYNWAEVPVNKYFGIVKNERDWTPIGNQVMERVAQLLRLSEASSEHHINVVLVCHERGFGTTSNIGKKEGEEASKEAGASSYRSDPYADVRVPRIGPKVTPSVAGFIMKEVNYIGQMSKQRRVITRELDSGVEGVPPVIVEEQTKDIDYVMLVGEDPLYHTGFRRALGLPRIQKIIVDPSYEKIVRAIRGETV